MNAQDLLTQQIAMAETSNTPIGNAASELERKTLIAERDELRKVLNEHHKHASQDCLVRFVEPDGKICEIEVNLGESYGESELWDKTNNAIGYASLPRCEGCEAPATHSDSEGNDLCAGCYIATLETALVEAQRDDKEVWQSECATLKKERDELRRQLTWKESGFDELLKEHDKLKGQMKGRKVEGFVTDDRYNHYWKFGELGRVEGINTTRATLIIHDETQPS